MSIFMTRFLQRELVGLDILQSRCGFMTKIVVDVSVITACA